VNEERRISIQNNHTATHLLHFALRRVLGTHVEQKGSMVSYDKFRFDFSHFSKVEDAQLREAEIIVNELVRANIPLCALNDISMEEAVDMGAIALFGEKYGDNVRVIKFGDSVELCGGTHTSATGNIGFVRLMSESAIAAGVRRIEAITGKYFEDYLNHIAHLVDDLKTFFKSPNIMQALQKFAQENEKIRKEVENFAEERIQHFSKDVVKSIKIINGYHVISFMSQMLPEVMKRTAFNLRNHAENMVIVFGTNQEDKPTIIVALSDDLVVKGLNAVTLVREVSPMIEGGGGGQPTLATAGGKNSFGLEEAMKKVLELAMG
jgi:alanyl-tRNA synthetase